MIEQVAGEKSRAGVSSVTASSGAPARDAPGAAGIEEAWRESGRRERSCDVRPFQDHVAPRAAFKKRSASERSGLPGHEVGQARDLRLVREDAAELELRRRGDALRQRDDLICRPQRAPPHAQVKSERAERDVEIDHQRHPALRRFLEHLDLLDTIDGRRRTRFREHLRVARLRGRIREQQVGKALLGEKERLRRGERHPAARAGPLGDQPEQVGRAHRLRRDAQRLPTLRALGRDAVGVRFQRVEIDHRAASASSPSARRRRA